jgi:hypothetical protein
MREVVSNGTCFDFKNRKMPIIKINATKSESIMDEIIPKPERTSTKSMKIKLEATQY